MPRYAVVSGLPVRDVPSEFHQEAAKTLGVRLAMKDWANEGLLRL